MILFLTSSHIGFNKNFILRFVENVNYKLQNTLAIKSRHLVNKDFSDRLMSRLRHSFVSVILCKFLITCIYSRGF
jgi:hypothetical protein